MIPSFLSRQHPNLFLKYLHLIPLTFNHPVHNMQLLVNFATLILHSQQKITSFPLVPQITLQTQYHF